MNGVLMYCKSGVLFRCWMDMHMDCIYKNPRNRFQTLKNWHAIMHCFAYVYYFTT